jgi:hypothetical protein
LQLNSSCGRCNVRIPRRQPQKLFSSNQPKCNPIDGTGAAFQNSQDDQAVFRTSAGFGCLASGQIGACPCSIFSAAFQQALNELISAWMGFGEGTGLLSIVLHDQYRIR